MGWVSAGVFGVIAKSVGGGGRGGELGRVTGQVWRACLAKSLTTHGTKQSGNGWLAPWVARLLAKTDLHPLICDPPKLPTTSTTADNLRYPTLTQPIPTSLASPPPPTSTHHHLKPYLDVGFRRVRSEAGQ